MSDYSSLQQKEIVLDLSNVPREDRSAAKEAVANFLLDQIQTNVAQGISPVTGDHFKKLSDKYADREKGGDTNPNLYLEGDMLSSLGYKNTSEGIAVGIMDASQRPKADGHNNLSGDSKLPERRFIPDDTQEFDADIMSQIPDIIAEFETPTESNTPSPSDAVKLSDFAILASTNNPLSVTLGEFLAGSETDIINTLLKKVFK